MLPHSRRLPYPESIKIRKGIRSHTIHFQLTFQKKEKGHPRLLISIPKSKTRLATRRNRLKRLISESILQLSIPLPPLDGIILQTKPYTQEPTLDLIKGELKDLFSETQGKKAY